MPNGDGGPPPPPPSGGSTNVTRWLATHRGAAIGIAVVLGLALASVYAIIKKRQSTSTTSTPQTGATASSPYGTEYLTPGSVGGGAFPPSYWLGDMGQSDSTANENAFANLQQALLHQNQVQNRKVSLLLQKILSRTPPAGGAAIASAGPAPFAGANPATSIHAAVTTPAGASSTPSGLAPPSNMVFSTFHDIALFYQNNPGKPLPPNLVSQANYIRGVTGQQPLPATA